MKLKYLAFLLAGALAASCLTGYTCSKGDGESPTETETTESGVGGGSDVTDGEGGSSGTGGSTDNNGTGGGIVDDGGTTDSSGTDDEDKDKDDENTDGDENTDDETEGGSSGSIGGVDGEFDFEKGEEVTAEEWVAIITETNNLKNYEVFGSSIEGLTVTGNFRGNENFSVNIEQSLDVKSRVDVDNGEASVIGIQNNIATGLSARYGDGYIPEEDMRDFQFFIDGMRLYFYDDYEEGERTFESEQYEWIIDDQLYRALKSTSNPASGWQVEAIDTSSLDGFYMLKANLAIEEGGEEKPLAELYDAFEYSDGVYTANFWIYGREWKFSLAFKDGCILNYYLQWTQTRVEEGLTITHYADLFVKVVDVGNAVVNPSPEAVQAVEDFIKGNS